MQTLNDYQVIKVHSNLYMHSCSPLYMVDYNIKLG